ncbi:MAG TPA: pyridoxamine 5'-phosphate oxidase family protein [Burkholderiaceae bacterium]|nr:pyridoxamine 5'-phosphate oxidase family protein [Burkholderiaceae bacterium]
MSAPASKPALPGWPHAHSPFHAGEQALQARAGVREKMEQFGRKAIRDFMPEQHRQFFAELPFIVIGALDGHARPWASILVGVPGFMASPDARTLRIDALPAAGDPCGAGLAAGQPVGLLGIQPHTRRRNRMNGIVTETSAGGFAVAVRQSFGNCPKYIQARTLALIDGHASALARRTAQRVGPVLDAAAHALIEQADTFFIATASSDLAQDGAGGIDVSHRGGKPGFVRVSEGGGRALLTVPDFVGNSFFNTLGNLAVNPRAGLVFVDFAASDALLLTGTAEVLWDGPALAAFAGAQRLLVFAVDESVWLRNAVPLRWSAPALAPELAATGTWPPHPESVGAGDDTCKKILS